MTVQDIKRGHWKVVDGEGLKDLMAEQFETDVEVTGDGWHRIEYGALKPLIFCVLLVYLAGNSLRDLMSDFQSPSMKIPLHGNFCDSGFITMYLVHFCHFWILQCASHPSQTTVSNSCWHWFLCSFRSRRFSSLSVL